jgi:Sulfotransferase domain
VLLLFAGGHRMGSTYQYLIGLNALKQLGLPIKHTDNPALTIFHLQKVRKALEITDESPASYFIAKAHAAFPEQVDAVLTAKNARIFLVWRDQKDSLVSDYHFAQRKAGHVYSDFDDYFLRRGRKILTRNCLQQLVWQSIDDDRVRAWDYLDLVYDFETSAKQITDFAGLQNVDIDALKAAVSIKKLRETHNDPDGKFFRVGGKQNLLQLNPSPQTLEQIESAIGEKDIDRLASSFEKMDWLRTLVFGQESCDAGIRKTFHWWLYRTKRAQHLRESVLPHAYKLSPRRLGRKLRLS